MNNICWFSCCLTATGLSFHCELQMACVPFYVVEQFTRLLQGGRGVRVQPICIKTHTQPWPFDLLVPLGCTLASSQYASIVQPNKLLRNENKTTTISYNTLFTIHSLTSVERCFLHISLKGDVLYPQVRVGLAVTSRFENLPLPTSQVWRVHLDVWQIDEQRLLQSAG